MGGMSETAITCSQPPSSTKKADSIVGFFERKEKHTFDDV